MGFDRLGIYLRRLSDSSGYDTSDVDAVGSLYSPGSCILLLAASDFLSECLLCVRVCSILPPPQIMGLRAGIHNVFTVSCASQL